MTQEEKQLLFKDLCARLPYGVVCQISYTFINETTDWEYVESTCDDIITKINFDTKEVFSDWLSEYSSIDDVKPYLRPMSSMTEEEREYLQHHVNDDFIDYCNEHYLDYRGLISMGLALKAPKDMYKTEEVDKEKDLCQTCEHFWLDFPMPLDKHIAHCEVLDKKGGGLLDDVVEYPCLKCPFNSYSKKEEL